MITIWTSAKADLIGGSFGAALKNIGSPDHQFKQFHDEMPGEAIPWASDDEVVLVAGGKCLALLQKNGIFPKNRTVTSLREKPVKSVAGGWYLVTFDPAAQANDPAVGSLIGWDVILANRLVTTGSMKPVIGDYEWVGDFGDFILQVEEK